MFTWKCPICQRKLDVKVDKCPVCLDLTESGLDIHPAPNYGETACRVIVYGNKIEWPKKCIACYSDKNITWEKIGFGKTDTRKTFEVSPASACFVHHVPICKKCLNLSKESLPVSLLILLILLSGVTALFTSIYWFLIDGKTTPLYIKLISIGAIILFITAILIAKFLEDSDESDNIYHPPKLSNGMYVNQPRCFYTWGKEITDFREFWNKTRDYKPMIWEVIFANKRYADLFKKVNMPSGDNQAVVNQLYKGLGRT